MAKYSFEFKKKIVLEYLEGDVGRINLSNKYGIGGSSQLHRWISAYRAFGDDGLLRSREKKNYSFDFKIRVVESYLSSEVSYQELASLNGINNSALITKWVNDFRIAGPDALRPKKKGRKKLLDNNNNKEYIEPTPDNTSVDTSEEHVKQLENEVLKLRIENAYLKELRRLRLEGKPLKKKRE